MSRFLERVFDVEPDRWILKGGVGMMVRLPESRYSRDIDLLAVDHRQGHDPIARLREAVRDHHLDQFRFTVGEPATLSNGKGSTVRVKALLGGREFDSFTIDVVDARRELVGAIEHHQLPRLIPTDDFPGEARIALYPLADQVADKICAMYERHGTTGHSSGRYRDLVDLLLIRSYLSFGLRSTRTAVDAERALRGISALPRTMQAPGPDWASRWPAIAAKSPLPTDQHQLEIALSTARDCYDRILSSEPATGTAETWDPERGAWTAGVSLG